MRLKEVFLMFILAWVSLSAYAQSTTITGKVIDSEGYEVIGGSVTVKGAAGLGTVTNVDGHYTLKVNDAAKDVLVFSYVGMKSQEVKVSGQKVINVTLEVDAKILDEVVVVGYGTVPRKDLTGSVVSVKSEELMKVPTSDITQALAGRVAGVQVMQSEGAPGSSISIRVRGGISITQSNEPLYIIDGFPSEDGMSSLDPAEIETIDILKDASSTAIYGARGANGVVVITTKSGARKGQKMTVSFDSYMGVKKISNHLDVLSPQEFVLLDYERTLGYSSSGDLGQFEERYGKFTDITANYGNRKGIDWQNEALGRTAFSQNYRVGVAGGTDKLKYNASYSYFKDEGAMVYSGNNKHNISMRMSHQASDRLSFNARITFDQRRVFGMGTSENGDRFNKMQHILQYRPTIGLAGTDDLLLTLDEDPVLADDSGNVMQNPILSASEETKNKEYRTFQANGGFDFRIMKGLNFRNNTGMNYQTRRDEIFFGDKSVTAKRSSINGSIGNSESGSFQTSNVLSYNWKNKIHNLTVMAGQEFVSRWSRSFKAVATNFPNDEIGLGDLSLGIPGAPQSGQNYDDNLLSFFGRVNYNMAEKYLFTASLRADGSSKFGKNNKWGYFPSVSAAWRIAEEAFIKDLNIFSDLKLRVGYGMAGNNRIGSYNSLAILTSVTYPNGDAVTPGYASTQVPNPNLKWEANRTFNIGVDLGFFNQRLTISPEFYVNKSSNLLLEAKLPGSSGHQNMIVNAGSTKNTGFDLTINSVNIQTKAFSWNTNLTLSHNKNTVEALTGEPNQLWEAPFGYNQKTHRVAVGESLGQMYGYQTIGLYQVSDFDYDPATRKYTLKEGIPYMGTRSEVKPGMWKFANLDDSDDLITESDKTVIGNSNPVFYGGLNNTFNYKNFDLSVFLTFSYGNDVFNATKLTNTKTALKNQNVLDVCNSASRWMTINTNGEVVTDPTELAALNAGKSVAAYYDMEIGDTYIHSWAVEDASYLKLSNVTLGYTFPRKMLTRVGLSSLRLYATGSNLLCWTPYTGYDPEVSTMGNGLTPGVDFGAYPRSRSFVFGINLTF